MKTKNNLTKKAATTVFLEAMKDAGFSVTIYKDDGKESAIELEDWTGGGVDMIHFVDLRKESSPGCPFAIERAVKKALQNFDVDEEIRLHMEGDSYRAAFSYRRAVEDFEAWEEKLNLLCDELNMILEGFVDAGLEEEVCDDVPYTLSELLSSTEVVSA